MPLAVAMRADTVRVFHQHDGVADIVRSHAGHDARWCYQPIDGDPLHLGGALSDLDANDDGSITITFGPEAPAARM